MCILVVWSQPWAHGHQQFPEPTGVRLLPPQPIWEQLHPLSCSCCSSHSTSAGWRDGATGRRLLFTFISVRKEEAKWGFRPAYCHPLSACLAPGWYFWMGLLWKSTVSLPCQMPSPPQDPGSLRWPMVTSHVSIWWPSPSIHNDPLQLEKLHLVTWASFRLTSECQSSSDSTSGAGIDFVALGWQLQETFEWSKKKRSTWVANHVKTVFFSLQLLPKIWWFLLDGRALLFPFVNEEAYC